MFQGSYGFFFSTHSPKDRVPQLLQRLLLKYSVDNANYKRVINVMPLNDILLYNVPLAIQLDLHNKLHVPLIRHDCVYTLKRNCMGLGYIEDLCILHRPEWKQ